MYREVSRKPRAGPRAWMLVAACAFLHASPLHAQPVDAAGLYERVTQRAHDLAGQAYAPPGDSLPGVLADLSYDQYRDIRFRSARSLWRDQTLFEVEFFAPGFLYRTPVKVHVLDGGELHDFAFDPSLFDFGSNGDLGARIPDHLGFAGFRVHFPLNRADYKDELVAFLGASYFRFLGRGQRYGLSARGLAIDTALPEGEEFPRFSEFWLVRPAPAATQMTVIALLRSPSLTGAYRFSLRPGADTVVAVEARLFARRDVARLGVAPLTSMFFHGENSSRHFDDFRPEVHDSDGLLVHASGGEWIWRPLDNPGALHVSSLSDGVPIGFGLAQRDRDFAHYLDTETRYETHPGVWVRPTGGDWGKGAVQLVQIPADKEIDDNIVAYWVPEVPLRAGEQRTYRYTLSTFGAQRPGQRLARVQRTHIGWGSVPGMKNPPPHSVREFAVDFAGGELPALTESQPLAAELSAATGKLARVRVLRLPREEGWRVAFRLDPQGSEPVDLRLFLSLRGQRVSETWNYVWYPDDLD